MAAKTACHEEEAERFDWQNFGELWSRKMRSGQTKNVHKYQKEFNSISREVRGIIPGPVWRIGEENTILGWFIC